MKVNGQQCPNCKDIIYSRAGHDFRYCTCEEIYVDGGQSKYGGRVGYKEQLPEAVEIEIEGVDIKDLFADWNHTQNKLGLLKSGKVDLRHRIVSIGGVRFDDVQRTESDVHGEDSEARVPRKKAPKRASEKSE